MLEPKLKAAFKKALDRAKTQKELEKKTGIPQSSITHFLSGRRKLMNMGVSSLEKLFPEMQITFFRDELPIAVNSNLPPLTQQIVQIIQKLDIADQAKLLASLAANYPQHVTDMFSSTQSTTKVS